MPPKGWRKHTEDAMASLEERNEEARIKAAETAGKDARDKELARRADIEAAQAKASEGLPPPMVRSL